MAERIRRSGDRLVLTLYPAEIEVLRDLGRQLETLFADDGGEAARGQDPVRDRLFPRAYLDPTADEEEANWQAAVHGDLVRQKSEAVEALVASLDAAAPTDRPAGRGGGRSDGADRPVELVLDPEAAERWANALNDVRLALGVVLEVSEDEIDVAPGDPRAPGFELYGWLTWLQGSLVEALLGGADEIWRAARDYG